MEAVAVIRSEHLLRKEGTVEEPGYAHKRHARSLEKFTGALDYWATEYVILDEQHHDEWLMQLRNHSVKLILVPELYVCSEALYQRLLSLAEEGWIVFVTRSSFFYDRFEDGSSKRVRRSRLSQLLQVSQDSLFSFEVIEGKILFERTRWWWLTKDIRPGIDISPKTWILAIREDSPQFSSHGTIDARVADSGNKLRVPAFMVRAHESGGMFIYACIKPESINGVRQIVKNLLDYSTNTPNVDPSEKKERRLKTLVVVLTAMVFLLVAREIIGDTWQAYVGGIVLGIVVGVLGNKATDWIDFFTS